MKGSLFLHCLTLYLFIQIKDMQTLYMSIIIIMCTDHSIVDLTNNKTEQNNLTYVCLWRLSLMTLWHMLRVWVDKTIFVFCFCHFEGWRVCWYKNLCPGLTINVNGSRLQKHCIMPFSVIHPNNQFTIQVATAWTFNIVHLVILKRTQIDGNFNLYNPTCYQFLL